MKLLSVALVVCLFSTFAGCASTNKQLSLPSGGLKLIPLFNLKSDGTLRMSAVIVNMGASPVELRDGFSVEITYQDKSPGISTFTRYHGDHGLAFLRLGYFQGVSVEGADIEPDIVRDFSDNNGDLKIVVTGEVREPGAKEFQPYRLESHTDWQLARTAGHRTWIPDSVGKRLPQ